MGGVGIGGYSGARTSPPFLPNIIVIAGRVAAFPRTLGVTIIIEVEQDDREMWQLSHYSFDGGYHGGTVTFSTIFVDGPLKYLEGFHRFSRDDTWLCLSQRGLGVYLDRRCR